MGAVVAVAVVSVELAVVAVVVVVVVVVVDDDDVVERVVVGGEGELVVVVDPSVWSGLYTLTLDLLETTDADCFLILAGARCLVCFGSSVGIPWKGSCCCCCCFFFLSTKCPFKT